MSWTSNGFFRNVNVLKLLNAASGTNPVQFYKPGVANRASLSPNHRYSGFLTSLRLVVDISSFAEVARPIPSPSADEGEIQAQIAEIEAAAPKVQLNLLMQIDDEDRQVIGSLNLFNQRPYYTAEMLVYFGDAASFDIASDCSLHLQIVSVGYGVLQGSDRVLIFGSATEEAENSAPALNINIFGGGTGSGGSSGGSSSGQPVTDSSGQPLTTTNGELITIDA